MNYIKKIYHHLFDSEELKGIAQAVLACFWGAVMAVVIRYLTVDIQPLFLVFLRNVCAVLVMLPWAFTYFKHHSFHFKRMDLIVGRAVSGVIGMALFFYALYYLPAAQVTALSFTAPLITTLLAIIILKEKVSKHFWLALLWGFIGVLVIIRPDAKEFQAGTLFIMVATIFWAISNILVKKLTVVYPAKIMVFMMMCLMMFFSIPGALIYWQEIKLHQVGWIFLLGFATIQSQLAISRSYTHTDIRTVMPFDFLRLIFVSIFAYMIFGEVPDISTYLGACMIVISSLYVVYKVSKRGSVIQNRKNRFMNRI